MRWISAHNKIERKKRAKRGVKEAASERKIQRARQTSLAHGFKQVEDINFVETFAAVVKPMPYKCLFGVSVKCGYQI